MTTNSEISNDQFTFSACCLLSFIWHYSNSKQINLKKSEFSNLAVGLLDKCYKEEDELASQLLTYDLVDWSHWTCLTLAVSANLKDFLSHAACQLLINDLWMGGMKIRKHVIFKVIAALLFPPAIFAIQFKSAKELQYMPQTQEEHEQELENQDDDSDSESDKLSNSGSERGSSLRVNTAEALLHQRFGELLKENKDNNNRFPDESNKLLNNDLLNIEQNLVSLLYLNF